MLQRQHTVHAQKLDLHGGSDSSDNSLRTDSDFDQASDLKQRQTLNPFKQNLSNTPSLAAKTDQIADQPKLQRRNQLR